MHKQIFISGSSGSGKTTLANELSVELNVEEYIEWFLKRATIDLTQPFVIEGVRHLNTWIYLRKKFTKSILIYCLADKLLIKM